jgi:lysophospholipase L1-like esterase
VTFRSPRSQGLRASGDWTGAVHVPSKREGLFYELAPDLDCVARGMSIRTNHLGLRDGELLPDGTPELTRVAVIGDSMAFGFGVQQGEDFPAQLERELAHEPGRRVDVLNFGVGGYSTVDELAALRAKALPLAPSLVVLAYCLNDPEVAPIEPLPALFHPTEWWQHSHVLRLCASRLQGYRIRRYGDGNYWRALHAPDGPFWPQVARALDGIRDACRERAIPVLVVILPMLTTTKGAVASASYAYADLHAFVASEMTARGFDVLDLAPELTDPALGTLNLSPDDPHFTPEGNRLVARAIAKRVRERWSSGGER